MHAMKAYVGEKVESTRFFKIALFSAPIYSILFRSKKDELRGDWRRPHNEELFNLYASIIVGMIKSREMGGAGHVACMGDYHRCIQGFCWEI